MDEIDQIKQKIDIVDFIGEHIALKKAGRHFKALCPFHSEKTPSFIVSPERQTWHCFGSCAKGGDIFSFLQEFEHIEFGEALKILASRAGVKLTQSVAKSEREKKKDAIYAINDLAAHFYNFLLLEHPIGKKALAYLTDTRSIPTPLIKKFMLGYAPKSGSVLVQFLRKKGYTFQEMEEAGISTQYRGREQDFFRERIIFPISNSHGDIVAFSGRALNNQTLPKYINTRETLVYKKGDTLFALSQAKDSIKREGKVIVVEGEFDVISAFHNGITNIVAIKGTALTENQIKILKRYAQKVVFCFDTDPAGTAAQRRSIELIEKEGIAASVIVPPKGKDPDEVLREDPAAFKQAIKHDTNLYDFIIDSAVQEEDRTSAEGKKKILNKTLQYIWLIDNEVIKEHYLKRLAEVLYTSLESIVKQGEKHALPREKSFLPTPSRALSREELTQQYLLALILQSAFVNDYSLLAQNAIGDVLLPTPVYNRLFEYIKDFCKDNQFSLQLFVQTLPAELLVVFDTCYLTPLPPFIDEIEHKTEVEKAAHELKILAARQKLQEITEQIKKKEVDESELARLQDEFHKLTQLLK